MDRARPKIGRGRGRKEIDAEASKKLQDVKAQLSFLPKNFITTEAPKQRLEVKAQLSLQPTDIMETEYLKDRFEVTDQFSLQPTDAIETKALKEGLEVRADRHGASEEFNDVSQYGYVLNPNRTDEECHKWMENHITQRKKKALEEYEERRRRHLQQKHQAESNIRSKDARRSMTIEEIAEYMRTPITAEVYSTHFVPFRDVRKRSDPTNPKVRCVSEHQMGRMKQLIELFPEGIEREYFIKIYQITLRDQLILNGYSLPLDDDQNVSFKLPVFWIPNNVKCHVPGRILFPLSSKEKYGGSFKRVLKNYWDGLKKCMDDRNRNNLSKLFSESSKLQHFYDTTGFNYKEWGLTNHGQFIEILWKNFDSMQSVVQKPVFGSGNVTAYVKEQRKTLPIFTFKNKLIEAIKNNQMVIVIGETGSGKSTQIPQYVADAGLQRNGRIIVTQPRRVAAKSLACRVALERGVELGTSVGHSVRFDRTSSDITVINFITDGLLVKMFSQDEKLDKSSVIIIDEAHERSINTDVCFGLLKRVALKRPDLRIIICSATINEQKFSSFFNNAPVFKIGGRLHHVDIIYNPQGENYLHVTVDTIMTINENDGKGDILVFLSGKDEIIQVNEMLVARTEQYKTFPGLALTIIHCHGLLPLEEQRKFFEPALKNCRKVVLATNIAETSITIDGIKYVIDCGFSKQNEYNPKTGISSLVRRRITKFQAIQRAGRAGRTQPGKCYRLFSDNELMLQDSSPEITRSNLESVVLGIAALGIQNPLDFPFMDAPSGEALNEAVNHLKELSALDCESKITSIGQQMLDLPLAPHLAKVLIVAKELGCQNQMIKIVAMLSTQYHTIFIREDEVTRSFKNGDSDLITLLNTYDLWRKNKSSKVWCLKKGIRAGHLEEAHKIKQQLVNILRLRGTKEHDEDDGETDLPILSELIKENIGKSFTAGFFRHVAQVMNGGYSYQTIREEHVQDVQIHPSSSLHESCHPLIIYHDVFRTSRTFLRGITKIKASWVKEYAPCVASLIDEDHDMKNVSDVDDEDDWSDLY